MKVGQKRKKTSKEERRKNDGSREGAKNIRKRRGKPGGKGKGERTSQEKQWENYGLRPFTQWLRGGPQQGKHDKDPHLKSCLPVSPDWEALPSFSPFPSWFRFLWRTWWEAERNRSQRRSTASPERRGSNRWPMYGCCQSCCHLGGFKSKIIIEKMRYSGNLFNGSQGSDNLWMLSKRRC